jgi:hypothetical protein
MCHYLIDNNYPSVRTFIIARYSLTCTFRAILLKRRTGMPYSGALRVLRPSLRVAVVQFAPKVRVLA